MHVRRIGAGPPVVLVHGSLIGGRYQWMAQSPLAQRWELLICERPGYGPEDDGIAEDFLVDAERIAALLGDGAHLVGFSYGAVGCLLAAAERPEAVRSLALIEPSAWSVAFDQPGVQERYDALVQTVVDHQHDHPELARRFLAIAGSQLQVRPDRLPRALQVGARAVVGSRPSGEAELPLEELFTAGYPKLVLTGDHSEEFELIGDRVATGIGAARAQLAGAGHGVPVLGEPVNEVLEELWRTGERLVSAEP